MLKKGSCALGLLGLTLLLAGCGGGTTITCSGDANGMKMEVIASGKKEGEPVEKFVVRGSVNLQDALDQEGVDAEGVDVEKLFDSIAPLFKKQFAESLGVPEEDVKFEVKDNVVHFEAAITDIEGFIEKTGGTVPNLDIDEMQSAFNTMTCK